MAPKKSAPAKRAPAKAAPTRREKKTALATKKGYDSVEAMTSVTRQYGLVKNEAGKYVRPDMDFLTRQMEANGWGPEFQKNSQNEQGTPINIGGARWYSGKNGVVFSGERSDAAKNNPGAAYDSASQSPYTVGKGKAKGKGKGKKPRKGENEPQSAGGYSGEFSEAATAAADELKPYAEADVGTTSMLRAQGKAYAASRQGMGGTRRGSESTPEDDITTEEEGTAGSEKRKRRPAKKATRRAKRPSSPGGKKVTPKERKRIQAKKK